MIDAAAHFSQNYGEARDRFLGAARARGCRLAAHVHPDAKGPDGGELAIDVATAGDDDARAVLFISSGTHGVEGHAGSGIQHAWLHDDEAWRRIDGQRVRVVLLHALNPWGFAHDARGDENNVDLNRNFRDFSVAQGVNEGYAALHPLLVPEAWPPPWTTEARLWLAILRQGTRSVQAAISRGQCEFADGLFYGGAAASWSNETLRAIVGGEARGRAAVGWVDLHTGLGRRGAAEVIFNGRNDARDLARARRWWGDRVTSMYDGSSVSIDVAGSNYQALHAAAIESSAAVTVELGTRPPRVVLDALRARQWLCNHPDVPAAQRRAILAQSRAAFHVDDDVWKNAVYAGARDVLLQGVDALHREVALPG
jgi:hypothetical protein